MAPVSLIATLSLAFGIGSALSTLVSADPIHVPITRRKTARVLDLNAELFRLRQRYRKVNTLSPPINSSGTRRRAAVGGIPIIDQNSDTSYLGIISVGTPDTRQLTQQSCLITKPQRAAPQDFKVVLDTGSSDLWLANNGCTNCPSSTPTFNPSASSSFETTGTPIELNYGIGNATGVVSLETVQMGGFTIDDLTLVSVDTTFGILTGDVSGILGFAFQGLAATKAVPFWQALINTNQLTSPEFSFYLGRAPSGNDVPDIDGGVFTLGGTNETLFSGDVEFVDMPPTERNWVLSLTGLTVNGQNIAISTGSLALASIDTGTSHIAGPTADVQAFWAAVPNSGPSPVGPGIFNFPCTQELSVSVSFGGRLWPISIQDMIIAPEQSDSTRCIGAIFDLDANSNFNPDDGNPAWIFGDGFMKNVYTVFRADPPSIGFAQLATNAGELGTPSASLAPSVPATNSAGQSDIITQTATSGAASATTAIGFVTSSVARAPGITATTSPGQSDNITPSAATATTALTFTSLCTVLIVSVVINLL
ncbi:hypothetical protein D9619_012012 [Psilocybe cf. subviscida]|uniref:Peptidase A1 domain-containing protein n=1 Tax=Psilocybe cf. subviscida TaxID=2480587 RepID=A0A8H5B0G5_9AGAR|nr:hypothetical protein D9619_012012 [Psilocybe cf. subviscida]